MKRTLFATTLALSSLLITGGAQAASPASKFTFTGQNAYASFYSNSACTDTYVSAWAVDGRVHTGGGQPDAESAASVYIEQYNRCFESFAIAFGSTTLEPGEFQVDKSTATLSATIETGDDASGIFPVTIRMTWLGTGEVTRRMSHYVSNSPQYTTVYHSVGTSQAASASGTVTSSDGSNLTPDLSNYAEIAWSRSGSLEISRA